MGARPGKRSVARSSSKCQELEQPPAMPDAGRSPRWRAGVALVGVVLLAINMRAALAAVGPLVPDIRAALDLSRGTVSLLTALPVLCFGLLSTGIAAAGQRIGAERTLLLAMLGIAAGSLLRFLPHVSWLLAGTVVAGTAITAANVLLPGVVKYHFPRGSATVTGVYTAALVGGAAAASGASAPLAHGAHLGWRGALLVMAVPALVAAVVWLPQVRRAHRLPPAGRVRVINNPVTWALAVYMGMQSVLYYAVLTWLPAYLRDFDIPATSAGVALGVFNLIGVVGSLAAPPIAVRLPNQVPMVIATCTLWGSALAGLYFAPGYYLAWAVVAGVAQGACISIALTLILLRARTPEVAGSLSGAVQSIGYLIAALGPLVVGALRDLTNGWTVPFAFLGFATLLVAASAPLAAGRRQVG
ncbi:MAG: MFS transporter [Streptosporangiales bacterium]|nr:MFS transporter [Streptosporangiales bacterium]